MLDFWRDQLHAIGFLRKEVVVVVGLDRNILVLFLR